MKIWEIIKMNTHMNELQSEIDKTGIILILYRKKLGLTEFRWHLTVTQLARHRGGAGADLWLWIYCLSSAPHFYCTKLVSALINIHRSGFQSWILNAKHSFESLFLHPSIHSFIHSFSIKYKVPHVWLVL